MRGRNPFEEIEELLDRMSRSIDEGSDLPLAGPRSVSIDLADRGDEFVITADLPGYDKEDIELRLSDEALQLSASRETETIEEDEGHYVRQERRQETVSRRIPLPEPVDESGANAHHRNGVLEVTLPKLTAEDDDASRIDIE